MVNDKTRGNPCLPQVGEELCHVIMNRGRSFFLLDSSSLVFNPLVSESEVDKSLDFHRMVGINRERPQGLGFRFPGIMALGANRTPFTFKS